MRMNLPAVSSRSYNPQAYSPRDRVSRGCFKSVRKKKRRSMAFDFALKDIIHKIIVKFMPVFLLDAKKLSASMSRISLIWTYMASRAKRRYIITEGDRGGLDRQRGIDVLPRHGRLQDQDAAVRSAYPCAGRVRRLGSIHSRRCVPRSAFTGERGLPVPPRSRNPEFGEKSPNATLKNFREVHSEFTLTAHVGS